MFVKQLIQLKGMTAEKALAIAELFPTPDALMRAYDETPFSERGAMLKEIQHGRHGA